MATNVQGSASSIGMAPTAAAAAQAGPLPSLTSTDPAAAGADTAGAVAGTTAPGSAAPGAATPGAATPGFDVNAMAAKGRWLGPIMAIGGGIAALAAFKGGQSPSALLKWGGISGALSGLALTGVGFKAHGIQTGTKATEAQALQAMQALQQQSEAAMQNVMTQASTEITSLQQQLVAAQQGAGTGAGTGTGTDTGTGTAAGTGATTAAEQGAEEPVGAGVGSPVVPGSQQGSATSGTSGTTGATTSGQWSLQSLVGTTVQLASGTTATGAVIADPGNYRIEQPAGDANGYATVDEANAAARTSMSTELMGSKFLRWMVVEHDGRFYGVIAKQLGEGEQPNPITAELGDVVAWNAMNHVSDGGQNGWQAYTWSKTGGAQALAIPYGTTAVFPESAVGSQTGVSGGGGTSTAAAPAATAATGPVAGTTFDPASEIGRTFSVNASSTAEGDVARGGVLQLQKFIETSAGGFGTPEEAASAARAARAQAGGGDQWTRWTSMQGADGRYYVYQGSIVKRETAAVQNAAPVHVFGVGFAEYYDGASSAWKAVRDAA